MISSKLSGLIPVILLLGLATGCTREHKLQKHLDAADAYFKKSAYDEAVLEYANTLRMDAENLRAHEQLAQIWLERGAPLRALPHLLKLRKATPNNLEVRRKLLPISFYLGKLDEARTQALEILQRQPDDLEALVLLTRTVRSASDRTAAEAAVQRASRSSAAFHLASANLLLRRGDFVAARSALQRALGLDPQSPQVHSALAAFHLWQGNRTQAGAAFKAAADAAKVRSSERVKYAEFLLESGSLPEARKHLEDVTRQAPDYFPAWRGLAAVALAGKRPEEALSHLDKILSRDRGNYEARLARSEVWLAQGETPRAMAELEAVTKDFPGVGEGKYLLAQACLQGGDKPRALAALAAAIVQNPDLEEAILLQARLRLEAGALPQVAESMVALLAKRPNHPEAQMLLVEALRRLGRLDEIEQGIRAQIAAAPDRPEPHRLLGYILNLRNQSAAARLSFERSLEITPDFLPIVGELVALDLKAGEVESAWRRVQAQKARQPEAPALLVMEARVLVAQRKWDLADRALSRCLELEPRHSPAHEVQIASLAGRCREAGDARPLEAWLEKRPEQLSPQMVAAQVYVQLDASDKAAALYEKILTAQPRAAVVLNNLAYLYSERLDRLDRAEELAQQARKAAPESPVAADTLGWILFRRSKVGDALPHLEEAASRQPTDGEILRHFGLALLKAGQADRARQVFAAAAALPNDFPGKDECREKAK